jgi:hypothetical protein
MFLVMIALLVNPSKETTQGMESDVAPVVRGRASMEQVIELGMATALRFDISTLNVFGMHTVCI